MAAKTRRVGAGMLRQDKSLRTSDPTRINRHMPMTNVILNGQSMRENRKKRELDGGKG